MEGYPYHDELQAMYLWHRKDVAVAIQTFADTYL